MNSSRITTGSSISAAHVRHRRVSNLQGRIQEGGNPFEGAALASLSNPAPATAIQPYTLFGKATIRTGL